MSAIDHFSRHSVVNMIIPLNRSNITFQHPNHNLNWEFNVISRYQVEFSGDKPFDQISIEINLIIFVLFL